MTTKKMTAAVTEGASAPAEILFVCEHASCAFPEQFGTLGLSDEVLRSHVAWDPGALDLARDLAARFESTVVGGGVSRLLYDCNRPPQAPDAVPTRSEIFDIPGNVGLSAQARDTRVSEIYEPFCAAVSEALVQVKPRALVTVHSFTPIYHGAPRAVEIGILHDVDSRLADGMLETMQDCRYDTQRNEPYGPEHGVTHSLQLYAQTPPLLNVMLEVRNDLLEDAASASDVADVIEKALRAALADLPAAAVGGQG